MRFPAGPLLASFLAALVPGVAARAAPPRPAAFVAVLDLRSHLEGDDRAAIDAASLSQRVRRAAREAFPRAKVFGREEMRALLPDIDPEAGCVRAARCARGAI